MKTTPRRRGFVMLMAIGLLSMVGVALAVMTAMLAHESRRTNGAADDAQLRQVLIAAEAWLSSRPGSDELPRDAAVPVPLPPPLTGRGAAAEVRLVASAGDERAIVIAARLPDRHIEQTLRYRREGGQWKAVSAELAR